MEILCNFKGKTGKKISESSRLEFLERFLANNFALSDADDNTSKYTRLTFVENNISKLPKSQEPSFWEVTDSVLVAYASFAASRAFLQWLLAYLNFFSDSEDLLIKPWRWVRFDLILTMRDIYIISKYILPWNISQIITKTIPISMRTVINYVMKPGILLWVYWKVNGNWDNMIRMSQWRESQCRINTCVRRNISERVGLWKSQSGIQVGKITIWRRSFEIEKL